MINQDLLNKSLEDALPPLKAAIDSGKTTPTEALLFLSQYEVFRDLFHGNRRQIETLFSENNQKKLSDFIIKNINSQALLLHEAGFESESTQGPQIAQQARQSSPDSLIKNIDDISGRATNIDMALSTIKETRSVLEEKRRVTAKNYARELAKNWVDQIKKQNRKVPETLGFQIENSLSDFKGTSDKEIASLHERLSRLTETPNETREDFYVAIKNSSKERDQYIRAINIEKIADQSLSSVLYDSIGTTNNPDELIQYAAQRLEAEIKPEESKTEFLRLSSYGSTLSEGPELTRPYSLFNAVSASSTSAGLTSAMSKAVSPILDAIYTIAPESTKILAFQMAIDNIASNQQKIIDLVGQKMFDSEIVKRAITAATRNQTAQKGAAGQATNAVTDILSGILKGPAEASFTHYIQHIHNLSSNKDSQDYKNFKNNPLYSYILDNHQVGNTPLVGSQQMYLAEVWSQNPSWFHMTSPGGQGGLNMVGWATNFLKNWGTKEAGKQILKFAASKGIGVGTKAAIAAALGVPTGGLLGAVYFLGATLLEKGAGLFFGLINLLTGGEGDGDNGILWVIISGLVIILLLIFLMTTSVNFATLEGSRMGGAASEEIESCNPETDERCRPIECNTTNGGCLWPASGCIAQGPFTNATHKGGIANSIDIGGSGTVYATKEGKVSVVEKSFRTGSGSEGNTDGAGGYGNYIIIDIGNGESLLYGHLAQSGILVGVNSQVHPGTPLAQMDHTGNSSGPHLHYELRSTKNISSILPYQIPSCVGPSACASKLGEKACVRAK